MPTALITGSTSGIGAGFAARYARLGHNLVLVARDRARLDTQAATLHDQHRVDAEVLEADLGTDAGCAAVEARAADERRPIDVLVNNAGFGIGRDFLHSAIDDEEQVLRVMVRAPMRVTKAAVPGMVARGSGAVINVASVAAFLNHSTYGAAKAWSVRFSEALSLQLVGTGVGAIALCPGLVHTEFHERGQVDVSNAPRWMWLDVDAVIDACLHDLAAGKSICIPTLRYKAIVGAGRLLPASLVARARTLRRPKAGR
ncbi:MAG TPA: SDR family oxidoreductase [Acidothermaceae bacterium]|jgi:short-subunit dehydrogenase|nr:SDR family oxidoreductase [Acidothermaceae bacterium]